MHKNNCLSKIKCFMANRKRPEHCRQKSVVFIMDDKPTYCHKWDLPTPPTSGSCLIPNILKHTGSCEYHKENCNGRKQI